LDIFGFFGQYFDGWKILIGLIVLAIAGAVLFLGAKGKNDSTEKLFVRVVTVALIMLGVNMMLYTIVFVGPDQAMTITLIVGFIGSLWLVGAKGWMATIVGILLALILAVVLSVNVKILPANSPVAQFVTLISDRGQHIVENITRSAPPT
jgi:hypothetical protein